LAALGSRVLMVARNPSRGEAARREIVASTTNQEVELLLCDLSSQHQVRDLAVTILEHCDRLDVLVNNAGLTLARRVLSLPLDRWEQVLRVNITGTFLCSQAFGTAMIARSKGKIINIASVSGLLGKNPEIHNSLAYNTSKGAVVNMTRDLAVKWARKGVNVNAIAPGFFPASRNMGRYEERKEAILREIPMGRPGGPDDLKGPVVFLASDASDFVTGAILSVDGGVIAW